MPRPHRPTHFETQLKRENDGLKTTICLLRRELEDRQGAVGRLEILVRERMNKIDQLNDTIELLRRQNQKLDSENESLTDLVVNVVRTAKPNGRTTLQNPI